jgi:hypothetical protein
MAIQAVLTGDIVNSTKLGATKEKKLLKVLEQILSPNKYEFYRGDSFQALLKKPNEALNTALLCRTAAITITEEAENILFDVRISIGIGQVKPPVRTLRTAKGEAFVLSGRAFDELIKTDKKLIITSSNTLANEGLHVISDYINAIFSVMTGKQAEVIFELLKGQTQLAVAGKLKKSKSTISQHVSAGRWPEIGKLLQQYENIINQLP